MCVWGGQQIVIFMLCPVIVARGDANGSALLISLVGSAAQRRDSAPMSGLCPMQAEVGKQRRSVAQPRRASRCALVWGGGEGVVGAPVGEGSATRSACHP